MEISTVSRPGMHFTCEHEWIDYNNTVGFVGIAAFKLMGIKKINSIKWHRQHGTVSQGVLVAELYAEDYKIPIHAPVSCIILGPNPKLAGYLDLILESPESNGWVFTITPLKFSDQDPLLSMEEYQKLMYAKKSPGRNG
jgi:glycine cleavage system H protein